MLNRKIKIEPQYLKRGNISKNNFRTSELKRLTSEGVSLSKAAKLLGIHYQLAKTLVQ